MLESRISSKSCRKIGTIGLAILPLLCGPYGCQSKGSYKLTFQFPDQTIRDSISLINILAVHPKSTACETVRAREVALRDLIYLSRLTVQFPSKGPYTLDRIPTGQILFIAEGETDAGEKIVRGCEHVEIRAGMHLSVVIKLEIVCDPNPSGEVDNNQIDDDCDGLTDEPSHDAGLPEDDFDGEDIRVDEWMVSDPKGEDVGIADQVLFEGSESTDTTETMIALDTFTRNLSTGWGNAEVGGAYLLDGPSDRFLVDGEVGIILAMERSTLTASLRDVFEQDLDLKVRIKSNKPAEGDQQWIGVALRDIGDSNEYIGWILLGKEGAIQVRLVKRLAGVSTLLGSPIEIPEMSYQPDHFIWTRMQAISTYPTTLKIKIWNDSDPEPQEWTATQTDQTPELQVAGGVGLYTSLPPDTSNAPVQFSFDDLIVTLGLEVFFNGLQ